MSPWHFRRGHNIVSPFQGGQAVVHSGLQALLQVGRELHVTWASISTPAVFGPGVGQGTKCASTSWRPTASIWRRTTAISAFSSSIFWSKSACFAPDENMVYLPSGSGVRDHLIRAQLDVADVDR